MHFSTDIITVSSNSKHGLKGFTYQSFLTVLIVPFYKEIFFLLQLRGALSRLLHTLRQKAFFTSQRLVILLRWRGGRVYWIFNCLQVFSKAS